MIHCFFSLEQLLVFNWFRAVSSSVDNFYLLSTCSSFRVTKSLTTRKNISYIVHWHYFLWWPESFLSHSFFPVLSSCINLYKTALKLLPILNWNKTKWLGPEVDKSGTPKSTVTFKTVEEGAKMWRVVGEVQSEGSRISCPLTARWQEQEGSHWPAQPAELHSVI